MIVPPGSTSQTITVQIVDDSGLAVTALVAATFPPTYYQRAGELLPSAITLSDLAAQDSAWSSGGVKELTGGYYRLDVPNAAFTTASKVRIIGEATGKHLLFPPILVSTLAVNAVQVEGADATDTIGSVVVAALGAYGASTYAGADTGGTTTLLTRLTTTRAANLDNLDVSVNSRLATSEYTAPNNAGITSIEAVTTKLDTAMEQDGVVYRFTTNALEQAPTGDMVPTAGEIADAVYDELTTGHGASGSFGELLVTIGSRTATLGSGRITVLSPVLPSGRLSIIQGDTYTVALNRALTWTETNGGWPDLTGSTITLEINNGTLIATGSIVVATGSNKQVRVELSSTQTSLLEPSMTRYTLVATFSSTSRVTLAADEIVITDREDE